MGNYFSRRRGERNNIPSTISYFTNSFGLYFGPYFIMNRSENRNTNPITRNLINEQVQNNIMTGTGLLWSDLLEAIENGVITEQELSDFGISFGQTQISEYDAPITIQSLVNLHKHSIKIAKVEYDNTNSSTEPNNLNKNNNGECVIQIDSLINENKNYIDNKNCRVSLEFEYDSYTPCQVHLFWNAREVIVKNGNERKAIYLLNQNESRNSMTIGPLPAGNNQKFVLPNSINIPADILDNIIQQTCELSNSSRKNSGEQIASDSNTEVSNSNTNSNPSESNEDTSEQNATTSEQTDHGNSSNNNTRLRIGRGMFNHRRNSSRSTSRSNKKDKKEKKIIWFPLIIVLESLERKDEKGDDRSIKYQTTLLKLEINNDTNQYNIKTVDQKVMIKNNLYRLQEIYGFTDEDDEEVVTNEVNSSIECVICLSEPRNTIVLPCRHLCVCQDCADILCNQSRHDHRSSYLSTPRCPICRQTFHSFLRINMDYFNLTEESYEKSYNNRKINGSLDDISAAKGKKGDNLSGEKKYDIVATNVMSESDNDEESLEHERNIENNEEDEEEEEEEEEGEEEEKEEYDKSIYEDVNANESNQYINANSTVNMTGDSNKTLNENIKIENHHEERAECYSEPINDNNFSNNENSNRDDHINNGTSNTNYLDDGPNSPSDFFSLDVKDTNK